MPAIADARILAIATDGFEDAELLDPLKTLKERGAQVTLASLSRRAKRSSATLPAHASARMRAAPPRPAPSRKRRCSDEVARDGIAGL